MGCSKLFAHSLAALLGLACGVRSGVAHAADALFDQQDAEMVFERSVRPLLLARCVECHGPDGAEAGLRLDVPTDIFGGTEVGPVVVRGDTQKSRLIQVVRGTNDLQMPPDDKLSSTEIGVLEKWVEQGAHWPGYDDTSPSFSSAEDGSLFTEEERSFWSFRPVEDLPPPVVADTAWPQSPVDNFILAKLEAAGLGPSPPAQKPDLLRRVTFALTGLPPTPEQLADFIADNSPDAYEKVVDRLLASDRFGEHWAQHWLDVVRFAESAAHDGNNAYLHAWRYRDYVIKAFNEDKPYDQFIIEQLAGDLLPPTGDTVRDYDQIVATGFLQVGPKPVVMRDKHQMLLDIADEQLNTTGVAFMALTLGCARCHDHKFDPIPTADYYSLAGFFMSTHVMADEAPDSMWLEYQVLGPESQPVKVMAVRDLPQAQDLHIHRRGNYRTLGELAPRRFLRIIAGENAPAIEPAGSGRLELARWIANAAHPLTARVMVNRIWQHLFGRGIVATSGNFGRRGELPSHPELLDWLARRFVESGWSVKKLHRLLLLSSVYRQAYRVDEQAQDIDAENRLLWRMPRRRLEAETIRDAMLFASGELDLVQGGTLFTQGYGPGQPERELFVVDISQQDPFPPFVMPRRSIYLPVIRNGRPEILSVFDAPTAHQSSSVRGETTIPSQALLFMNSPIVSRSAQFMAASLIERFPDSADGDDTVRQLRIKRAYQALLSRDPEDCELQAGERFLSRYGTIAQQHIDSLRAAMPTSDIIAQRYENIVRQEQGLQYYQRFMGLKFDGQAQRVQVYLPNTANRLVKSLSVECWIRPTDVRTATIVGRQDPTGINWRIGMDVADIEGQQCNVVSAEFPQGGKRVVATKDAVLSTNTWSHVVVVYGGGKRSVFVNGQLCDEIEVGGALFETNIPITIGAAGTTSDWFRGEIDHLAIYNRDLDATLIARHHKMMQLPLLPIEKKLALEEWTAFCRALLCTSEFLYTE